MAAQDALTPSTAWGEFGEVPTALDHFCFNYPVQNDHFVVHGLPFGRSDPLKGVF